VHISGDTILIKGREVGQLLQKGKLYTGLLAKLGIRWQDRLSKRLLPDEAILATKSRVLTIVEKKYQQCNGSVDEKLQTCDFKRRQYERLLEDTGYLVQYAYLLNDWFKQPSYRDVLEYISQVKCHYFFNAIPLEFFRLEG
jgi:hypothetical protein